MTTLTEVEGAPVERHFGQRQGHGLEDLQGIEFWAYFFV
jgi:hypothetical protein